MIATKTIPDFSFTSHIDQVGIEERASRFTKRSIKNETKINGLKLALNMIDLTTLEGKDTDGKVKQLCYKAQHLHDSYPGLPTVAAICVYPSMVKVAKTALGNSGVKVASVSTAFPSGQAPRDVKIRDTKFAVDQGADEIDMVISRGKFHQGEYNFVFDEIAAVKEACGEARLKVILETGELVTYDKVRRASSLVIKVILLTIIVLINIIDIRYNKCNFSFLGICMSNSNCYGQKFIIKFSFNLPSQFSNV